MAQKDPFDMTDEELHNWAKTTWGMILGFHERGPMALFVIGEIQRRQSVKASEENKITSRLALRIALLSVVLALLSCVFAFLDYQGNKKWQSDQLGTLRQISDNMRPTSVSKP